MELEGNFLSCLEIFKEVRTVRKCAGVRVCVCVVNAGSVSSESGTTVAPSIAQL